MIEVDPGLFPIIHNQSSIINSLEKTDAGRTQERATRQESGRPVQAGALVQRRLVELLQGSRPLIEDSENMTAMEIVLQEILQDKITVDMTPGERKAQPIIERRDDDDDDEPRGRSRL